MLVQIDMTAKQASVARRFLSELRVERFSYCLHDM
jgi:hypothetical protein